ncbi:hypothetical protein DVH24_005191 [Malus domestica]|uniref:Uncharacterized protein n=1 Tax=Malus domestica TaxID=3750 RepID=A0A498IGZ7_MALDO|nr:hypothetical protein DVH24_005191 [Malus domestica]
MTDIMGFECNSKVLSYYFSWFLHYTFEGKFRETMHIVEDFDKNIEKMRSVSRYISNSFLDDLPKEHCSILHFLINRWGKMSNGTA